jgi:predicted nucleotidyltransferase
MSISEIISKLREHKHDLSNRYSLESIAVFGSYARGEQRPESDIDILVDINGDIGIEFIDLADEFENLFEQKVDLVSRGGIKPRYFEFIKSDLVYV